MSFELLKEKTERKDDAPKKRVELHAHTNMTQGFGICSAEKLIDKAARFGHSAVAITDESSLQAFPKAQRCGKNYEMKIIYGLEALMETPDDKLPDMIVLLAKNQQGLNNLYRLFNISQFYDADALPCISRAELNRYRDGILIGGCTGGGSELLGAYLDEKPWDELKKIAGYYDYIEITPIDNIRFLTESAKRENIKSDEDLKDMVRTFVKLGEELNIPVCAAGDVYYCDPEDSFLEEIAMFALGFDENEKTPAKHFRTTGEMLEEFSYLGEEKSFEAVVTNTNLIADMIEEVEVLPRGMFLPEIENAEENLKNSVMKRANEIYGSSLPKEVSDRIEYELTQITEKGYTVYYEVARLLVEDSERHGYHVGSRASVGSSLVAFLAGITEVNPLPAHYICPKCHHTEFIDSVGSGYDLPEKLCPECSEKMKGDGNSIPFETFAGCFGDKVPDIELNFAGEYRDEAQKKFALITGSCEPVYAGIIQHMREFKALSYLTEYAKRCELVLTDEEKKEIVDSLSDIKTATRTHPCKMVVLPKEADIVIPLQPADNDNCKTVTHFDRFDLEGELFSFDLFAHTVQNLYHYLEQTTGVRISDIPMNEAEVYSLLTSPDALGVTAEDIMCETGTLGLPELSDGFVRQLLKKCQPKCFSDAVKVSALCHGTGVWLDNAENIIDNGVADIKSVISTRDDIFNYLIEKGFDRFTAFRVMESVRKGKAKNLTDGDINAMRERGVPEWYIESMKKIRYLFPKAHATAYITASVRLGWYKIHYPAEFYAGYMSYWTDSLAVKTVMQGKQAVRERIMYLRSDDDLYKTEEDELKELIIFYEAMQRGIEFLEPDKDKSDEKLFTVGNGKIRIPYLSDK